MKEDEVYVGTKVWFRNAGFIAIAGQPPNGCDNIPVVEIKDFDNRAKGSKGSFKPDLIIANQDYFIVVECKPLDNADDERKLLEIDSSVNRLKQLYDELIQRKLFSRRGLDDSFNNFDKFAGKVRYCLAHAGKSRQMNRVSALSLYSVDGGGVFLEPKEYQYKIFY